MDYKRLAIYLLLSGASIMGVASVINAIKANVIDAANAEEIKEFVKKEGILGEEEIKNFPDALLNKPVKYIYNADVLKNELRKAKVKGLPRKMIQDAGTEAFIGNNVYTVELPNNKHDIIIGPRYINRNVLHHELGHRRARTGPAPKYVWPKDIVKEEEAAWTEAYKHVSPTDEDRKLLNTYHKARRKQMAANYAAGTLALTTGAVLAGQIET